MEEHAEHDDMRYVPRDLLEAWRKLDPLDRLEKFLVEEGHATREEIEELAREIKDTLDREAAAALESPFPPPEETLRGVYREPGYEEPWWPTI